MVFLYEMYELMYLIEEKLSKNLKKKEKKQLYVYKL